MQENLENSVSEIALFANTHVILSVRGAVDALELAADTSTVPSKRWTEEFADRRRHARGASRFSGRRLVRQDRCVLARCTWTRPGGLSSTAAMWLRGPEAPWPTVDFGQESAR